MGGVPDGSSNLIRAAVRGRASASLSHEQVHLMTRNALAGTGPQAIQRSLATPFSRPPCRASGHRNRAKRGHAPYLYKRSYIHHFSLVGRKETDVSTCPSTCPPRGPRTNKKKNLGVPLHRCIRLPKRVSYALPWAATIIRLMSRGVRKAGKQVQEYIPTPDGELAVSWILLKFQP